MARTGFLPVPVTTRTRSALGLMVAILLVGLSTRPATPASITIVLLDHGFVGDDFSIRGVGFGDRKGKLALVPLEGQRKGKLKILSWTDTRIDALIAGGEPGAAELQVTTKARETLTEPFTIDPPTFDTRWGWGIGPDPAPRGSFAAVRLEGGGKGTPRLTVAGIPVKVKLSHKVTPDSSLLPMWVFPVPESLADGPHDVVAITKQGTATAPGGLNVEGDDAPLGDDFLEFTLESLDVQGQPIEDLEVTLRIDSKVIETTASISEGLARVEVDRAGGPTIRLRFGMTYHTMSPLPYASTYPEFYGSWITYEEITGRGDQTLWASWRGPQTDHEMTVLEVGGGQIRGTFSGTIERNYGDDGTNLRRIRDGTFILTPKPRVR